LGLEGFFEAASVELVYPKKRQGINFAQNPARFRSGEIRILYITGNVERTIHFAEHTAKCELPTL
jgi:hypothetical protein